MTVAKNFSAAPILLGAGSGISIASFSTPSVVRFRERWSCSTYRTRRGRGLLPPLFRPAEPGVVPFALLRGASPDRRMRMRSGSSSSASWSTCSARSPVSLPKREKSEAEPASDEVLRRAACFSSEALLPSSRERSECSSEERGGGAGTRVRRGMGAREGVGGGILPAGSEGWQRQPSQSGEKGGYFYAGSIRLEGDACAMLGRACGRGM